MKKLNLPKFSILNFPLWNPIKGHSNFFLRLKTRFFFRKFLAGFRDLHFGVRFKNNRYSAWKWPLIRGDLRFLWSCNYFTRIISKDKYGSKKVFIQTKSQPNNLTNPKSRFITWIKTSFLNNSKFPKKPSSSSPVLLVHRLRSIMGRTLAQTMDVGRVGNKTVHFDRPFLTVHFLVVHFWTKKILQYLYYEQF